MTSPQSDDRDWRNRRTSERDAAGLSATKARQELLNALAAGDPQLARSAAVAYGVLVDRAEALDQAIAASTPTEKKGTPLDELAKRRDGRAAS
jgi:DNA-binding FadR family transcriptional regulator